MSESDNCSLALAHSASPSNSCPVSKTNSVEADLGTFGQAKSTNATTLNVLFLGETSVGGCSIIDLVAGPREQRTALLIGRRAGKDVRSLTLGGNTFKLYTAPTSGSVSSDVHKGTIQSVLTDLHRNGGVHLLVYCINASCHSSGSWIREAHCVLASSSFSTCVPAVAVVSGAADVEKEDWWSSNEDALAKEGLDFKGHTFIRMSGQSPAGEHILESRRGLHALILQNYPTDTNAQSSQHKVPHKQPSRANSLQTMLIALAGKNSPNVSTDSKPIVVVLLGETGVGKSSLINVIAKDCVANVSSDTVGCTRTTCRYIIEEKGRTFHLYDTPGLVDPRMGVDEFVTPIVTIQELMCNLDKLGGGPDLLLFCVDDSKPTAALQRNYRLFHKIICGTKVPSALAITKLDEGQDADQWWNQHRATIRKFGIEFSGHVGFQRERRHVNLNPEIEGWQSRDSLLSICAMRMDGRKNGLKSMRSLLGHVVSSATALWHRQSTLERSLIDECGLNEKIAEELAKRLNSWKQSNN